MVARYLLTLTSSRKVGISRVAVVAIEDGVKQGRVARSCCKVVLKDACENEISVKGDNNEKNINRINSIGSNRLWSTI